MSAASTKKAACTQSVQGGYVSAVGALAVNVLRVVLWPTLRQVEWSWYIDNAIN